MLDGQGALWVGNDGGVHLTADQGATFTNLSAGLSITEFNQGTTGTSGFMLAGTQANGTLAYSEGEGWKAIEIGDGGFSVADPRDPNTIYVTASPGTVQDSGVVEKSTDGGATFSVVFPPPGVTFPGQFIAPLVMDPSDPDTLYYGQNQLFKTTDAGATWTAITPVLGLCPPVGVPAGSITSIAPAPSDGLAGKYVTSIVVNPVDAEQAFVGEASFGMQHLYRTDDAGETWVSASGTASSALPDVPVDSIAVDWAAHPMAMYAGTDAGAFYSTDDGLTWSPLGTGLPTMPVMNVLIDREAGRLIALTHGRGAFWLSLASITVSPGSAAEGEPVAVSASGFGLAEQLDLTLESTEGALPLGSVMTDGSGSAILEVAAPEGAAEAWTVRVTGTATGLSATAALTVLVCPRTGPGGSPHAAADNDDFAGARTITGASGDVCDDNSSASEEPGEPVLMNASEPLQAPVQSVWYRWTAPADGEAVFDTCLSGFDTVLGAYTGDDVASLVQVAGSDDPAARDVCGRQDAIRFPVLAETTYRIAVDGYADDTGELVLTWRLEPPDPESPPTEPMANDALSEAVALVGPGGVAYGTTLHSTCEPGEPACTASAWYSWIAPASGILAHSASTAVYVGAEVSDLTPVADAAGRVFVDEGSVYAIQVDLGTAEGKPFAFGWSLAAPASNDDVAAAAEVTSSEGSAVGSTVGATQEPGEPYPGDPGSTVWYRYTALVDGALSLDTAGTRMGIELRAYVGSEITALLELGAASVAWGDGTCRLYVSVAAGETILVSVSGLGLPSAEGSPASKQGAFTLNWAFIAS